MNQTPNSNHSLPSSDVPKALGIMMLAFRDRSSEETAAAYLTVLSGIPAASVCEAIGRFLSGEVERNHAFAPSATEIAAEASRIERMKAYQSALAPSLPERAHAPEIETEEHRSRMRKKLAVLSDAMHGRRPWSDVEALVNG